ncbi:GFA family protein [Cognaticolwellia mytili]|uniref:GFA family protein n=1 Tax=Cognaticolwellia mytili TaxID=1888913 RepID=UPI000A16E26E|nr:GFA family protein [Cognaticolwellia mytili]
MKNITEKNKGSCLCDNVSFTVVKLEPLVGHCHCTMCRKFHGAAFSTFVEVKLEHLTWLSGESELSAYQAENNSVRKFCQHCGSSLLFISTFNQQAKTVEIALACFDEIETVTPDAHIYLESKIDWYASISQLY